MKNDLVHNVKKALQLYVDTVHQGKIGRAEAALGLASTTLWCWLQPDDAPKTRTPSLSQLSPILDQIGVRVIFPWDSPDEQPYESVKCAGLLAQIEQLKLELVKRDGAIEALNNRLDRTEQEKALLLREKKAAG